MNDRYDDYDDRYGRGGGDRYERDDYFDRNYNIDTRRDYCRDTYSEREPVRYARAYAPPKKRKLFEAFRRSSDYSDYESEIPANIVVCFPKTYGDVRVLIDSLKHRQPIIADLAKINESSAQRILDFMSGAVYALSGSMHKIQASIFLLTPEGMSIKIPVEYPQK